MLLVVATATFTGVKNEILLAAYVGTHVIHTRVYIRDHPSYSIDGCFSRVKMINKNDRLELNLNLLCNVDTRERKNARYNHICLSISVIVSNVKMCLFLGMTQC